MIVNPNDVKKYTALNNKLNEFCLLQDELQFKNTYEPKFKNILMCSASKLVGCNARIKINPRAENEGRYGNTEYVLTRQGIKESFGYTGEFKARFMSYTSWINDYASNNSVTVGLVKLLKSKELQSPEALRLHLQAREDISKLGLEDENYAQLVKTKNIFTIMGNIELGEASRSETTNEVVLTTSNSWSCKSFSLVEVGSSKLSNNSYRGKSYDCDIILGLSSMATFIEYLRISEEPTYTHIMDLLDEHITKCQAHIKSKQASLDVVTNKYGQYLVFKEL